jgi:PadR family transcriptional regulator, regulatory protein AphA
MSRLTPFSYAVLVLVGENGAGPHDLVRMMRQGRVYWTAPESQYYAEPKRLAEAGYLSASKEPGRTHARTHYRLTDQGREALREWLATPAPFARIQNEPVVRLLGAEFADRETVLAGLQGLRAQIAELAAGLDAARENEPALPRRATALAINQSLARRILQAHLDWLDEVEEQL